MILEFQGKYRFLSNFYPCEIYMDGRIYRSVEAAYQAAKTLDINERIAFETLTPGQAKRMGRSIKLRSDWENIKCNVMFSLLVKKFANPLLRTMLKQTSKEHLQEGNRWNDKFWGVCLKTGEGENNLGKMLMYIREHI